MFNYREKLAKFDTDGDGQLDLDELSTAFEVFERQQIAHQINHISLTAFPPKVQPKLKKFDASGECSGSLSCCSTHGSMIAQALADLNRCPDS